MNSLQVPLFPKPSFTCLSNPSINVLLKKLHPSLEGPRKAAPPPLMLPKTGTLWKQTPISRALIAISSRVPSEGALPPHSPHRALTERDALSPEPTFIHLSKSPVYKHSSRFPSRPPWREMPISRVFLYTSFWIPPPGAANRAAADRDAPFLEPSFNYLSKFPVNRPPSQIPQWGPYGKTDPFPEPSSTHPLITHLFLKVPSKVAPPPLPFLFTQQGPYRERGSVSRADGLFIHLYLSESPIKEPSHGMGENIWSLPTEPHMDSRPTYN